MGKESELEGWKSKAEERSEERNEGERKGLTKVGSDGKPPTPPSAITPLPKQVPKHKQDL
jgi:hypothetical protein